MDHRTGIAVKVEDEIMDDEIADYLLDGNGLCKVLAGA